MSDFGDLQDRVTQLEDARETDAMDLEQQQNDLNQTLEDIQNQISTDEETLGQLTFPLSQDTIDLIDECTTNFLTLPLSTATQDLIRALFVNQLPRGTITLSSGVGVVTDSNVLSTSLIMTSRASANGSTKLGFLYLSAQVAGSFTITSLKTDSSGTETSDNSIINYVIF